MAGGINGGIPIAAIAARYMVKYDNLNNLIPFAYSGSDATNLNIYIDLYGLYKHMCSRHYYTDMSDYTAITSELVNICGHYRAYFRRIKVHTKIFLISSFNVPDNATKFVAGYNKTFVEKMDNKQMIEMISFNKELLSALTPYLFDIHFLHTEFESTVLIKKLIELEMEKGNNNPNLIISSDLYPIQLTYTYPDTSLLVPIKVRDGDVSEIVCPKGHPEHQNSFFRMIYRKRGELTSQRIEGYVSTSNYVLLSALSRFPERNMKAILNFSNAMRIINEIANGVDIKLTVQSAMELYTPLSTMVPVSLVESRYKVLDVEYQYLLFEESTESKTILYENIDNPEKIQIIDNAYFSHNPLDIYKL